MRNPSISNLLVNYPTIKVLGVASSAYYFCKILNTMRWYVCTEWRWCTNGYSPGCRVVYSCSMHTLTLCLRWQDEISHALHDNQFWDAFRLVLFKLILYIVHLIFIMYKFSIFLLTLARPKFLLVYHVIKKIFHHVLFLLRKSEIWWLNWNNRELMTNMNVSYKLGYPNEIFLIITISSIELITSKYIWGLGGSLSTEKNSL